MLWMFLSGVVWAQAGPVPVTQGVEGLGSETLCPTIPSSHIPGLVKTSVGPVWGDQEGVYGMVCPEVWGDGVLLDTVRSTDGERTLFTSSAGVFLSEDGGCSSTAISGVEGQSLIDAAFWRQTFWFLSYDGATGRATLFRLDEADAAQEVVSWGDFRPDGMAPAGEDVLWLSGVAPQPQVRRLTLLGGLGGDVPVENLPTDVSAVTSIVPVAAANQEVWFKLKRGQSTWLWHAIARAGNAATVVNFKEMEERPIQIAGPEYTGAFWLAAIDGQLHSTPRGVGELVSTEQEALWTCMDSVGERVFACAGRRLLSVNGVTAEGEWSVSDVFEMVEVSPPTYRCDASESCQAQWDTLATTLGYSDDLGPAVCPDGRLRSEFTGESCGCNSTPNGGGGILLLTLGLAGLRRRQRGVSFEPTA